MNVEELQTALVWWDTEGSFHHGVGPIVEMVEAARLYQNLIGQGLRQERSVSSQRWITDWAALTPGDIERNWNDRGEMMDR